MYLLKSDPSWVFTPGAEGEGTLLIAGKSLVIEEIYEIRNVTRNAPLYYEEDHRSRITVEVSGGNTTITFGESTIFMQPDEVFQVLLYSVGTGVAGTPTSNVAVTNFPSIQNVSGSVDITNEVEVKNDAGNPLNVQGTVTVDQGTSPWVVQSTSAVQSFPANSTDAFARLRVSNPYTLFDSSHRYQDNRQWATALNGGGASTFNANEGSVLMSVTGAAGDYVYRETSRVFSYQPGKSLLVLSTFAMNAPKVGLRQRNGYYNSNNGYFVELGNNNASLCFVERSSVSGTVVESRVSQAGGLFGPSDTGWNVDKLDGTGPSGLTLDITKSQILWMDLEWLGVGSVRMGFVIDGQFHLCHVWHHANVLPTTYMTTASLPMRTEIENLLSTSGPSTLRQICSTVISEGGYILTGDQYTVGTPVTTPYSLTTAGVLYPVASVRLKSSRLDAVALLTGISLMGSGNNETFQWQLISGGSITGGSWLSPDAYSSVDYNLTGTSITGGKVLASGYLNSSNQGSPTIDLDRESLFSYQLERDSFSSNPYSLTLAVASAGASSLIYGSVNWQEISR